MAKEKTDKKKFLILVVLKSSTEVHPHNCEVVTEEDALEHFRSENPGEQILAHCVLPEDNYWVKKLRLLEGLGSGDAFFDGLNELVELIYSLGLVAPIVRHTDN